MNGKRRRRWIGLLLLPIFSLTGCFDRERLVFHRDQSPAPVTESEADLLKADFRYSPSWWQTSVCLPDDWQKTLVSREGAFLYEYLGNFSDFGIRVAVSIGSPEKTVSRQQMKHPRIPIVETALFEETGDELLRWASLAVVPGPDQNLPVRTVGRQTSAAEKPPRGDVVVIKRKKGNSPIVISIDSVSPLTMRGNDRGIYRSETRFLAFSHSWQKIQKEKNRLILTFPRRISELALLCAPGQETANFSFEWAQKQLPRSEAYWLALKFPYDRIVLSDPPLQALLDSCIRNIYQAREVRDGLPVFQVGPTCYRGLWIVDGAFILEAMTFLGEKSDVRSCIRYLLSRQKADGSFEILPDFWKENGIVLYILYRHALLTRDSAWLKANWPVVRKVVAAIRNLRRISRKNPKSPEAGLMPPGYPDGGIDGAVAEYTNVYWNLAGMRAAVEAARLIGAQELAEWDGEYRDFLDTFRSAAARDERREGEGRPYLPILMKNDTGEDPVRGQWAFCHAVYPGQVFDRDDPLVLGNMALLDAHSAEGLVRGTGWMKNGIWNYFGSFYAHAHLWLGQGEKASRILYAFANHASPLRAWREEQPLKGEGVGDRPVGDMPHNWASAEFIRLIRNLLILERGSELHLLEGVPRTWLRPGARTVLKDIATHFGPVTLTLDVTWDGLKANLAVILPGDADVPKLVVHLGAWAGRDQPTFTRQGNGLVASIPLFR